MADDKTPKIDTGPAERLHQKLVEIDQTMGGIISKSEALASATGEIADEESRKLQLMLEVKNHGTDRLAEQKEAAELALREAEALEKSGAATAALVKERRDAVDAAGEDLAAAEGLGDVTDAQVQKQKGVADQAERGANASARQAKIIAGGEGSMSNMLTMMTGISNSWEESAIGAFILTARVNGLGAAFAMVGAAAKSLFTTMNILMSMGIGLGLVLLKMAFGLDSAKASLNETTGAMGTYNVELEQASVHTAKFGLSSGETGKIFETLKGEMLSFHKISHDALDGVVALQGAMTRFGVSGGESTKALDHMIGSMGMGTGEAKAFSSDLVGLGQAFGTPARTFADFNAHFDTLAIHGKNAGKEFKKLTGISKGLGMEMGELISLTEQYNTLTGAMAASAQINAVLGDQLLDANKMYAMSEGERIIAMKQAYDQSGKNFAQMGRGAKNQMIEAFGLKNAAQANKFFSQTTAAELEKLAKQAEETGKPIGDLIDAADDNLDAMTTFKTAFSDLAKAMAPVAEAISWVAKGLASLTQQIGPVGSLLVAFLAFKAVPLIFSLFGALLTKTAAKIPGYAALNKLLGTTGLEAGAGQASAATGTTLMGQAASMSAGQIVALGFAILLVAAGIALIVLSLAVLASQMSEMSGGQMAAFALVVAAIGFALWLVIPAIMASAATAGAATVPWMTFGKAALLVGVGVALAGLGMYLFAAGFLMIAAQIANFALFVGLMAVLALTSYLVGAAGGIVLVGFLLMAAGLMALAFALFWISTDDLQALGDMMMGLGKVAEFSGKGISEIVPTVKSLMYALMSLGFWLKVSDVEGELYSMGRAFHAMGRGASLGARYLPTFNIGLKETLTITAGIGPALKFANDELERFFDHFGEMFGMALGVYAFADALDEMAWGAYWLGDALDNISPAHAIAFSTMMEEVGEVSDKIVKISPTAIDNVGALVEHANDYAASTRGSFFSGVSDGFVRMLEAANGAGTAGQGAAAVVTDNRPIILQVNERELGRAVKEAHNKHKKITG